MPRKKKPAAKLMRPAPPFCSEACRKIYELRHGKILRRPFALDWRRWLAIHPRKEAANV